MASDELIKAYHRLFEVVWLQTGTVDIADMVPGHNGISFEDSMAIEEAASAVEQILAKENPGKPVG